MSDSDPIKLGNFKGSIDADAILRELDNQSAPTKRSGQQPPAERPSAPAKEDGRRSRIAFWALSWILIACIVIQVFLAGLAVFGDSHGWSWHVDFVHFWEFVPVIMLILSFTGHMRHSMKLLSVATIILVGLQYAFIQLGDSYHSVYLKAVHPVNALVIIWVAIVIARRANDVWREKRQAPNEVKAS